MSMEAGSQLRPEFARLQQEASAFADMPVAPAFNGPGVNPAVSFADSLREAVHAVDAKSRVASDKMTAVETGRSDDLVGAMLASQEASLSFSMLMQVRNKVVGAVEELVKLQL